MPTYHSNSIYGKLQSLLSGNVCPCRQNKAGEKPFCLDCYREVREKDLTFLANKVDSSVDGLEEYLNLIEELDLPEVK